MDWWNTGTGSYERGEFRMRRFFIEYFAVYFTTDAFWIHFRKTNRTFFAFWWFREAGVLFRVQGWIWEKLDLAYFWCAFVRLYRMLTWFYFTFICIRDRSWLSMNSQRVIYR